MSEFECLNGHIMSGPICKVCGERVAYMDGVSNAELRAEERESRYDDEWEEDDREDA